MICTRLARLLCVAGVLAISAAGAMAALADDEPADAGAQPQGARIAAPADGLALLRDDAGRFDAWVPSDWRLCDSSDAQETILTFTPEGKVWTAALTIRYSEGAQEGMPDDLDAIAAVFDRLLSTLPGSRTHWQMQRVADRSVVFEARHSYTYSDGDSQALRWVRLVYAGQRRYILTAEATSSAEFAHFAGDFGLVMLTFRLL